MNIKELHEASYSFSPEKFEYVEEFSLSEKDKIGFAEYIARHLDILGVTQEKAAQLYRDAKEGKDDWIHRLGDSEKFKKLAGHGIATYQTPNYVGVMNGAGLLGGVIRVKQKPVKQRDERIPDDLQPGGHDTDEYYKSRDEREADMWRDNDMNWSGMR